MRKAGFIFIILFIAALLSCSDEMVSDTRIAMDTLVAVSLPESNKELVDDVFDIIYETEHEISPYIDESYISEISRCAGVHAVAVPHDIYTLIKSSVEMAYETDGVFNPAIGPLSSLWALGSEDARVPESDEIEAVLPLLDYTSIVLDDDEESVYLSLPGMALDLGGAGKGYTADRIREFLKDNGVERAIINLGGNVLAYGKKSSDEAWRVGIRTPDESGGIIYSVEAEDMCVITSGVYQRYIDEGGVRYHHIMDSSTGYPFDSDILSATVITYSGTLGDMLSTTLLALGSENALLCAAEYGVRCVLVLEDGSVIDSYSPECQIAVMEE